MIADIQTHLKNILFGILAIILFFSPIIFGAKNFTSDGQLAAYYSDSSLWSSLWAGGWPAIADATSMTLYPVKIFSNKLNLHFDVFVIAAYVILFSGSYLYCNRILGPSAGLFAALTFCLSGWMLMHLGHTSMIHSVSWIPWMLYGAQVINNSCFRRRAAGMLIVALAVAMCLTATHLQMFVLALILLAASLLASIATCGVFRYALLVGCAVLLGLGLAAPVIIPTLELFGKTVRTEVVGGALFDYSLPVKELPALILPFLFGATPNSWLGVNYENLKESGETLLFFLPISICLLVVAVTCRESNGIQRPIIVYSVLLVFSIVVSLGDALPLGAMFLENVPIVNKFRAPARYLLISAFALSILSGYGFRCCLYGSQKARLRLASVLIVVLLTASVISFIVTGTPVANSLPALVIGGLFYLLSFCIIAWLFASNLKSGVKLLCLVSCLLIQNALLGYQMSWMVYAPKGDNNQDWEWAKLYKPLLGENFRALAMDGWQAKTFNPEIARLYGIPTLGWYGPLLNRRMAETAGLTTGGWTRRELLDSNNVSLDLLSVKFISVKRAEAETLKLDPARWKHSRDFDDEVVYENLRVEPRVRLVKAQEVVQQESGESSDKLENSKLGLDASLVELPHKNSLDDGSKKQYYQLIRDTGSIVELTADAKSSVYLVLADTYYPGWRAYINNREVPVHIINNNIKTIKLDFGHNRILFKFRPSHWFLLLAICLTSASILLFIQVIALKSRYKILSTNPLNDKGNK